MKLRLFAFLLLLSSCGHKDTPQYGGCMDPKALNYNSLATYSTGNCQYGGSITIYRASTAGDQDMLEYWLDSATGKGLHLMNNDLFNNFPTVNYPCFDKNSSAFFIPIGKQIYQLKKHLANGQVIILTQPDTVDVYNRFCKIIEVK